MIRRLGRALLALVRLVFVYPVRHGRLRFSGLPAGLGALLVCGTVAFTIGVALTALAPWLRTTLGVEQSKIGLGAPTSLQWVILALLVIAVALIQTATLHTAWWTKILGLAVSVIYFCALGLQTSGGVLGVGSVGWFAAGWLVLLALTVIRWRGEFAWWEFVVVLAALAVPSIVTTRETLRVTQSQQSGSTIEFTWYLLLNLAFLAGPIVLAAGFALAQVAYTSVVWATDLARRNLPRAVLVGVLVVVLVWRLAAEAYAWWQTRLLSGPRILQSIALLGAAWLVWFVLDKIADRRAAGTTRAADLGADLQRLLLPVAVIVTGHLLVRLLALSPPAYVGRVLAGLGFTEAGSAVEATGLALVGVADLMNSRPAQLVVAAALLAFAVRRALRADRGSAELFGIVAVLMIVGAFWGYQVPAAYLPLVVMLILTGLFLGWVAIRGLTPQRTEGMIVAVLLTAVFGARDLFSDPLAVVLGGSAAVLFGLIWGFLTGAGGAGTARFPAPSRNLFFVGNSLLGVAVVAFVALAANPRGSFDADAVTSNGDQIFGSGLLIGAMVAVVLAQLRDRDLGAPE